MQKKAEQVKKLLKVGDISLETVKYYGFDYPKVFNRFRCSSISDTSTYSGNTIKYKSGDALEDNIDHEMFKLLTCRSKLTIITCWFKNEKEIKEIETEWTHKFHIHCKKEIIVPYNALDSLIYHLFCGDEYITMKEIHSIRKQINNSPDQKDEILTIFMLEAKFDDSCDELEVIEFSSPPIYVSKNRFDTYQTGCIYFCKGSMKHLELQDLNGFLAPWMRQSRLMFLTVRNYIFNCFTQDNYHNIVLFSSIVLYILGLRPINDIDIMIYKNYCDIDRTNKNAIDNLTKFPFIDLSVKQHCSWKRNWDIWLDKWAKLSGIETFDNIISNSEHHFYYFGVKIIGINVDIARRIERNRPAAIADLIMINSRLNHFNVKIPKINSSFNKYISLDGLNKKDIEKYQKEGYKMNNEKTELVLSIQTDKLHFKKKILKYLMIRYKDTTYSSISELDSKIYGIKRIKIRIKKT